MNEWNSELRMGGGDKRDVRRSMNGCVAGKEGEMGGENGGGREEESEGEREMWMFSDNSMISITN